MAEPQSGTEPQKASQPEAAKQTQAGVPGEARSFKGPGEAPQARTGEGGERQLAQSPRRASYPEIYGRAFDPFTALQMDMNRWFDDLWRQATGLGVQAPLRTARPLTAAGAAPLFGMPPTDFKETAKSYELAVELPGMKREDIEVSLQGDALTIQGQKSEEAEEAQASYRVSERRFGRFERTFPLPDDVDASHIDASFRDGVLRISLPKTPEAAARQSRIEIKG